MFGLKDPIKNIKDQSKDQNKDPIKNTKDPIENIKKYKRSNYNH